MITYSEIFNVFSQSLPEIGKETIGSKQVIQFHCFEKWIKNQTFKKLLRIKESRNSFFLITDSNQKIKEQIRFTDSNKWIEKHFFESLIRNS